MHGNTHVEPLKQTLKNKVKSLTKESVNDCYQCGKCSAGCPLAEDMDIAPNQILRMLQISSPELEDKILRSLSIWLCLGCETCYTRCPQEVDLPAIMDYLRSESMRQNKVHPEAKKILAFHKTFLDSVKATGRLYEVGLIGGYKLRGGNLLQDVNIAPTMFLKGKLKLFPHFIEGRDVVSRIIQKTLNKEEGK